MQPIPATAVFAPAEALPALHPLLDIALTNAGQPPAPPSAIRPRPHRGDGPLRSGNPNLAPRSGARARSGNPCRATAMKNGRCRLHGGKATGPRTPEGLARIAAADTTHEMYCEGEMRDALDHGKKLCRRIRLACAAVRHDPWLSRARARALAVRLEAGPAELQAQPHYSHTRAVAVAAAARAICPRSGEVAVGGRDARGRFAPAPLPMVRRRVAERQAARVEAAALAPLRAGIARARLIKRLLQGQERAARRTACGLRSGLGRAARVEEPRQDPMNRGAVRADGGPRSGLGQEDRIEKLGQKPMQPSAECVDGGDGGPRSGLAQEARIEELGQKPMQPSAVRADGGDGGPRSGLAQEARIEELGQKPMQPSAECVDGGDGGPRSGLGQETRIEELGQKPMQPSAVRADGAGGGPRSGFGQEARIEELRQDPMDPGAVRADGGRNGAWWDARAGRREMRSHLVLRGRLPRRALAVRRSSGCSAVEQPFPLPPHWAI
jgi:ubiquitin